SADAQPLVLYQIKKRGKPGFVLYAKRFVDHNAFEIGRNPPLPDAFGDRSSLGFEFPVFVPVIKSRTARVGDADDDILVARLEAERNASERAARTHRTDKAVDPALGVAPDFRCGRVDVALAVGDIIELIGPDGAVWVSLVFLSREIARDLGVVLVACGRR